MTFELTADAGDSGGGELARARPVDRSGRRRAAAANVAAVKATMFRSRIDYHWLPDKRIEAVLTITLPDGNHFRFSAQADPHEIAAALAALHPEVGGFSLGGLWKGIKKVAKSVATSKVFKMAGSALAMAAPALGPLAPMALGASAAMKASTALLAAKHHSAKGNKAGADKLIAYAANAAKVVDRTNLKMPKAGARPATRKATAAKGGRPAAARPTPLVQLPSAAVLDSANATAGQLYSLLRRPA